MAEYVDIQSCIDIRSLGEPIDPQELLDALNGRLSGKAVIFGATEGGNLLYGTFPARKSNEQLLPHPDGPHIVPLWNVKIIKPSGEVVKSIDTTVLELKGKEREPDDVVDLTDVSQSELEAVLRRMPKGSSIRFIDHGNGKEKIAEFLAFLEGEPGKYNAKVKLRYADGSETTKKIRDFLPKTQ